MLDELNRIHVTHQIVENASCFGGDISKGLIIGGDSAGGNLTATISHIARDDPFFAGRQPTGQIIIVPPVIDPRAYPEKYALCSLASLSPH